MNTVQLFNAQTCLSTSFNNVEKITWSTDQPENKKADVNVQENMDMIRGLAADGTYVALAPHVPHESSLGFPILGAEEVTITIPARTPENLAAQKIAMAEAEAAGQVPYHYVLSFTRWTKQAVGKNPDRQQSSLAGLRGSTTPNIAG